ncbi:hypothetical protein ACFUJU_13625 [Streptomyces sp. NPDC057235]|uniref:hypothetical protein n=1 Tax=Streptomyces sp. NPDC057235 TaxID=3346058 RepID=UPI003631DD62
MDRIYMNRIDGQRRIHIEIHDHEISDLLDDLQPDPEHFDSTKTLLGILRAAEETFSPGVAEGRRDAARQATGQADTETCVCGHEKVGHGSLDFGPVRCLNCRCTAYTPVVGQPAATPDTEARPSESRWYVVRKDGNDWIGWSLPRSTPHAAEIALAERSAESPDDEFHIVRETTTWTVEDETR